MKKFVTLFLVLVMLLASAVAFADDTKTVPLSLTLEPQYLWTVPPSVTLVEPAVGKEHQDENNKFDVEVTKFTARGGKHLTLTFPNPTGNLEMTEGSGKIPYTLYYVDGSTWKECGTEDFKWIIIDRPCTKSFGIGLNDVAIVTSTPGTYTASVTFKMAIE